MLSCVQLCNPQDSSVHGVGFPGKNAGVGCIYLIEPTSPVSPALQVDSLPLESLRKPKGWNSHSGSQTWATQVKPSNPNC